MKKILFLILLGFSSFIYAQEFPVLKGDYLGQTPPGDTPVVFAPGIVSTVGYNEHALSVSPDGNEIYFTRDPIRRTFIMKRQGKTWSDPVQASFTGREAIFSPDGLRLFYNDGDICYMEKKGNDWSSPIKLGSAINSKAYEYYASADNERKLYFSRIDADFAHIYETKFENGQYLEAKRLPSPINLDSCNNYHPFISPKGDYIIFNSNRAGGLGGADLYICFKKDTGDWGDVMNLGNKVNSDLFDLSPVVSPDGKYFFFTKYNTSNNEGDIYWVSTKVIDDIKKTVINSKLSPKEIHDAAAAGDLIKVKMLLEADPTLLELKDERDQNNLKGNTPLISACWSPGSNKPQVAIANYLIDKGANVNAKNESGATPLYFAIKDFELTQRLIAKGANVNIQAFGDFTPLHQVASKGNLKVAKLLIDHGADPNVNGSLGTVLQYMIQLSQPNEQMAKLLVENGAKLNQKSDLGNTLLHLAALKGSADWTRILVKLGADVNAVNDYGHTPLYYAAKHGYHQAADVLIAADAKETTIAGANYGKAQQLNEKLKQGEAYLWYLGGTESPYAGYAVKTKEHLLIFNPPEIDDSPEAGLANGHLNPNELAGQKITALILYPSYQGQSARPSISELGEKLPGINVVLNFKPTADTAGGSDLPPYHLATPHESFSVDGIQVHTIPAVRQLWFSSEGLGYLVDADGVKIFHAGAHAPGNEASEVEKYRKEIDYLKSFGPIDIEILPVNGRHMWWIDYQSYLYLIDQLSPKAIYLIGDDLAKNEHQKCIEVLRARNIPVAYPEGGIAVGERFHYLRDDKNSKTKENNDEPFK